MFILLFNLSGIETDSLWKNHFIRRYKHHRRLWKDHFKSHLKHGTRLLNDVTSIGWRAQYFKRHFQVLLVYAIAVNSKSNAEINRTCLGIAMFMTVLCGVKDWFVFCCCIPIRILHYLLVSLVYVHLDFWLWCITKLCYKKTFGANNFASGNKLSLTIDLCNYFGNMVTPHNFFDIPLKRVFKFFSVRALLLAQ